MFYLSEAGGLVIDGVAVTVTDFSGNTVDASQTDVVGTGAIDLKVTAGDLVMASGSVITAPNGATINVDAGKFDVSRVETGTADMAITTSGAITDVLATEAANFTGAKAVIRSGGAVGTLANDINTALAGLDAVVSGGSTLVINEQDTITVTQATVSAGTVKISAGAAIENLPGGPSAKFTATSLILSGATGLGTQSSLLLAVANLTATSTAGAVNLRNQQTSATTVTVNNLATGVGSIALTQESANSSLIVDVLQGGTSNGDISVVLESKGVLRMSHVSAGTTGVAGSGKATFTVIGEGKVLLLDEVRSASGIIDVSTNLANGAVLDGKDGEINTHGAKLEFAGRVTLQNDVAINTGGGNVVFNQPLDGAGTLTINAGGGTVSFAQVTLSGDIDITSGALLLTGGAGSVQGDGSSTLVVRPGSNVDIAVGDGVSGGFSLSSESMRALTNFG
ncbi:MAG: hypothetical protein EBS01_11390, partial [Verrucomicrobia bacterium]|nr:hypothetical protein [Verrucomicrobiota bacterium]